MSAAVLTAPTLPAEPARRLIGLAVVDARRATVHRTGDEVVSDHGPETVPSSRLARVPTTLTWLGHAAFRLDTEAGSRVYVDPFLTGNPSCPESSASPSAATSSS